MNCPKCNYPAAPNQKFCEFCGAAITPVQIDMERTVAADIDDVPAPPHRQEPQPSWSTPAPYEAKQPEPQVQQAPQTYEQPVQQTPQTYEQPVQQAPQTYEPPVQQAPQTYEQPVQQASQTYEQPVQQAPQTYEQPVQQAPQTYEPPVQQAPQTYEQPVQQAPQTNAPQWPEGGSVASAWQTPAKDYSQMYENYNKPSQYSNGQNYNYGYSIQEGTVKTVNKKKIAIIIASAVVAVGLIVALIIIIASCSGGGSHTVKNADGIKLASDSAINTSDSEAERKLAAMLQSQGLTGSSSSISHMQYYAKGNTIVQEEKLNNKATDQEKELYKSTLDSQLEGAESKLPTYRAASGVNDLVCVYALLDADNEVIYSRVIK